MSDLDFMRRALALAQGVMGRTGDNPAVGCVLTHQGRIVGAGATQPPGCWHAEVEAIRATEAAGIAVDQCDLYVTLEPCSFYGRTPACAALILAKRPRRVIIGVRDPHPRVRGSGVEALRRAGIPVIEGVLAGPVRDMLQPWFARWQHVEAEGVWRG